jgi:hypothetical protein
MWAQLPYPSQCFKPMIRARLTLPNSAITGSTFKFHDGAPTANGKLRHDPVYSFAATNYYKSALPILFLDE